MRDPTETSDDQPQGGPLEQATRRLAALAVRDAVERAAQRARSDTMPMPRRRGT
jgi:hypothetical protein